MPDYLHEFVADKNEYRFMARAGHQIAMVRFAGSSVARKAPFAKPNSVGGYPRWPTTAELKSMAAAQQSPSLQDYFDPSFQRW